MMKGLGIFLIFSLAASSAIALSFDGDWKEQRFSLFSSNDFIQRGDVLEIESEGTVSLLWRPVPSALQKATQAKWAWSVTQSVVETDLVKKGGDDRNLSLYFVFLPEALVATAESKGILWLLDQPQVKVLLYVWGSALDRGKQIPSPYLPDQGVTVILRPAGTGSFQEDVDLTTDYQLAFGSDPGALVGLAVSADSDDTDGLISARIEGLTLLN